MAYKVHQYNKGVHLAVVIKDENEATVDISTSSGRVIRVEYPDGTVREYAAALVSGGTTGEMEYVTATKFDLGQAGAYRIQGFCIVSTSQYSSDTIEFTVHPILKSRKRRGTY